MTSAPRIACVAALADDGVIGRNGTLPWHLPADLKRFRALTWGKPVLMGRATFESLGKPLPGRPHIVLSRRRGYAPAGVQLAGGWDEALALAGRHGPWAMVIGGAQVFAVALAQAERLYLTHVQARVDGDVRFPAYDTAAWRLWAVEAHGADARNAWPMRFCTYVRSAAQHLDTDPSEHQGEHPLQGRHRQAVGEASA